MGRGGEAPICSTDRSNAQFEATVNVWRGWTTVFITLASIAQVLASPSSLLFWSHPDLTFSETGIVGFVVSLLFGLYLLVDSVVAVVYRTRFKRSMTAVY